MSKREWLVAKNTEGKWWFTGTSPFKRTIDTWSGDYNQVCAGKDKFVSNLVTTYDIAMMILMLQGGEMIKVELA